MRRSVSYRAVLRIAGVLSMPVNRQAGLALSSSDVGSKVTYLEAFFKLSNEPGPRLRL